MRAFLQSLLSKLYVYSGIDQAGKLSDKQITELLDGLEDECNRKDWEKIKPEVKKRIIEEAVKTEKEFYGLNVKFLRYIFNKHWSIHGGKILEQESHQKTVDLIERTPEELKRIDIIANGYLEQIKNGAFNVREVPKLSPKEIEEEGQERPKLPTYIPDERYVIEAANKMNEFRRKVIRDRHPELSDDEIEDYINKL